MARTSKKIDDEWNEDEFVARYDALKAKLADAHSKNQTALKKLDDYVAPKSDDEDKSPSGKKKGALDSLDELLDRLSKLGGGDDGSWFYNGWLPKGDIDDNRSNFGNFSPSFGKLSVTLFSVNASVFSFALALVRMSVTGISKSIGCDPKGFYVLNNKWKGWQNKLEGIKNEIEAEGLRQYVTDDCSGILDDEIVGLESNTNLVEQN